ncbi:STING domain-containing protein [Flavobacterium sp. FlaQc-50]|jgi:hypothetical protein|uniref:CBASS system CD-NTase-associated NAD(+) hydrolase Cap12 n=1 Tax=unclassified Flavobacterium TaxID=196869 RepID=UPI0037578837
MKKRIFIGSSSEELGTAEIVKAILEKDFDVTIWNDTIWEKEVFKINNNFLTDLLKAPLKFDFGILIGSPDDETKKRGEIVLSARDNILFELGLFIGRLGLNKCAFLVNDKVEIPSDFGGIYLSKFNSSNLANTVNRISKAFLESSPSGINFFPSSTLAFGYFENFVKPLCLGYFSNGSFKIDGADYKDCKFRIMLPEKLSEDVNLQYQKIKHSMGAKEKQIESLGRTRTYNIDVKSFENGKLEILDFPTTLTGINYSIKELLPDEYKKYGEDYKIILNREVENFSSTLIDLINKNDFQEFAKIEFLKQ